MKINPPFKDKLKSLLKERSISTYQFSEDTGLDRANLFYRKPHKRGRHTYMAIAYYLHMDVEELIAGTDAEIDWYGDCGI